MKRTTNIAVKIWGLNVFGEESDYTGDGKEVRLE
jgi:hypothetical protein